MNVDIAALRAIERDKEIPFDTVLEAIETALLTAYRHTEGHQPHARIDIDRKTGLVRVMAQELDADGAVADEWDDTPEGFGRIAATTARQVIVQRLRDAEHERTFGEFSAKEGEIVTGVVQRDARANARGVVVVALQGQIEGVLPQAEQVPGESYAHGERIRCYVVGVTRGMRGTADHVEPHAPEPGAQAVRARGAGDRRRLGGDRRGRPRGRATAPRSPCGRRSPGSTPRAPASARWAHGCAAS